MKTEIPIMFCFDNNYVIPAAVAFYSLLENANKKYYYKFYVLHSDITLVNQEKLIETINEFSEYSSLEFIDMSHRFDDLWQQIKTKGHFSKEVMYKVLVASIFPQYEKIIVSDVDVVFLNDISESYLEFKVKEDYYLAGVKAVGKIMDYMNNYKPVFNDDEIEKLSGFCGGYIVFNLKKLREDNMEEKFIECFKKDGNRINQMEQDVLNLCCYPKTKKLHLKYVACSYMWDYYKEVSDFDNDQNYSRKELEEAMKYTVQLHYATSIKPWKNPDCTKGEEWFKYLVKTPFLNEYLKKISIKINNQKKNTKTTVQQNKIISFAKKVKYFILHNPKFFLSSRFYKKLYKKIENKFFGFNKKEISLLLIDDTFPSNKSSFRYEEILSYLNNIYGSYYMLSSGKFETIEQKKQNENTISDFVNINSEFNNRIGISIPENVKVKLAYSIFLNNIYNYLPLLEEKQIPFIFTLYPGGGFSINNDISDDKLQTVMSSSLFKKVIVTQSITYDYLINKNFCKPEQIQFIFGGIVSNHMLNNKKLHKKNYGINKESFDVCFVAHKYDSKGKDKGYDIFIKVAKALSKKYDNMRFHVVGEFTEKDININAIKSKIKFYGVNNSEWFKKFYIDKDIILSPNKAFVLSAGSFDGFPTTCCLEAMLNGVALFCTDELKLNMKYKDGKEIVVIQHDVSNIVEQIVFFYNNPKKLIDLAQNGFIATKKYYSFSNQIKPRIKLMDSQLKNEKQN